MDWLRKLVSGNRQETVQASPAPFEQLLTQALRPVLPSTGADWSARDFLAQASADTWVSVDERVRGWHCATFATWTDETLPALLAADLAPDLRQPLLFLAACHRNGRIRQRALDALPRFPGRLALAAALIRCADWVPQVQAAAQSATYELLALCSGEDIVAVWPLYLRLLKRGRAPTDWLQARVGAWMLHPSSTEWRNRLLASAHAPTRAWVFEHTLALAADTNHGLLDAALRDPSPNIGLLAFRHLRQRGDEAALRRAAEAHLKARHPVIRRTALRLLADSPGALSHAVLLDLLDDPSAGVRSLAAFLLRERHGESPLPYWRARLDAGDSPARAHALAALAERAEPEDAPRLRRVFASPRQKLRRIALRGLAKSGDALTLGDLAVLLRDARPPLLHGLGRALASGAGRLDADDIVHLLESSPDEAGIAPSLLDVVQYLGHWDQLSLLLDLARHGRVTAWRGLALDRWRNQQPACRPLMRDQRARLLEQLASARAALSASTHDALRDDILAH